jgi:hypothetical protein
MPNPFEALTTTVYTHSGSFPTAGMSWTTVDDTLELDVLDLVAAPGFSHATFTRKYGKINGAARAAANYVGGYVKVEITDGTDTISWWGYAAAPRDEPMRDYVDGPTTYPTGNHYLTVFDLGHYLDRELIAISMADNGTLQRVVPLNFVSRGRNRQLQGNQTLNAISQLAVDSAPGTGDLWTAKTALEYWVQLVTESIGITFVIRYPAGTSDPDFENALDEVQQVWDWEGKTFWKALQTIINPEMGFMCWLDGLDLHINSVVDTDIDDSGGTTIVPANPDTVTFGAATLHHGQNPTIDHLHKVHFDKVVVRGAPLRITCTLSTSKGNLEAGWDPADETTFGAAGVETQSRRELKDVYRLFKIPDSWDGEDGSGNILLPVATTTGGVDWATKQPVYLHDLQIEKLVPIDGGPEAIRGWVFKDGEYYNIADNPEGSNASISVMDYVAGLRIQGESPASFGLNHPVGDGDDQWDWENLFFTVSFYTNDHLRYELTSTEPEPGDKTRTKYIDVPELQWHGIAVGTWKDAYAANLFTQATNATLRDDSAMLEKIALVAEAYYGRRKSVIKNAYFTGIILDRMGDMVTAASYGGSQDSVGTVIQRITYDFRRKQRTSFQTDLLEPDFTRWFSRGQSAAAKRRTSFEDANAAQGGVVVPAAPGGGALVGAGTGYIAKITGAASPASYYKYKGDIWVVGYYNGSGGVRTPDLTNEDIWVVQANANSDWSASGIVRNAILSTEGHYEITLPITTAS